MDIKIVISLAINIGFSFSFIFTEVIVPVFVETATDYIFNKFVSEPKREKNKKLNCSC